MTESLFPASVSALPTSRQVYLLLRLLHNLTVAARAQKVSSLPCEERSSRLLALNELAHQLTGVAAKTMNSGEGATLSDEDFRHLSDTAVLTNTVSELGWALETALKGLTAQPRG
jgi:hypothetical protein